MSAGDFYFAINATVEACAELTDGWDPSPYLIPK